MFHATLSEISIHTSEGVWSTKEKEKKEMDCKSSSAVVLVLAERYA